MKNMVCNNKLILVLCILTFFGFTFNVNAECSTTEINKLKKLAVNVNANYKYHEDAGTMKFEIVVTNVFSDLFVYDEETGIRYDNTNSLNGEIRLKNLNPNTKHVFTIYSYSDDCVGYKLLQKTVTLPSYNAYYKDPVCNGKESYTLCKKWTSTSLPYEQFLKEVSSYSNLNSNENKTISSIEENSDSFYDILLRVYSNYYFIILPIIIVTALMFIFIKKNKENIFK